MQEHRIGLCRTARRGDQYVARPRAEQQRLARPRQLREALLDQREVCEELREVAQEARVEDPRDEGLDPGLRACEHAGILDVFALVHAPRQTAEPPHGAPLEEHGEATWIAHEVERVARRRGVDDEVVEALLLDGARDEHERDNLVHARGGICHREVHGVLHHASEVVGAPLEEDLREGRCRATRLRHEREELALDLGLDVGRLDLLVDLHAHGMGEATRRVDGDHEHRLATAR